MWEIVVDKEECGCQCSGANTFKEADLLKEMAEALEKIIARGKSDTNWYAMVRSCYAMIDIAEDSLRKYNEQVGDCNVNK